ncbi:uncharacterized protein LOC126886806 [Diabrotica virgifera virgifera]|uniref:Uncharacterized protein n=1 Tax=Diabrotica virgifera virgifera TaxID=50390 RepID=A0ABM5KI87_DIAVI|nr:uncharacterized protein LOC126886806 [Diabrotica virgifera virgifera]
MNKIIVLLLLSVYSATTAPSLGQTDPVVIAAVKTCAQANSLSLQDFYNHLRKGEYGANVKEFNLCFYGSEGLKIVDDKGMIDKALAADFIRREYGDKAEDIIKNCLIDKDNALETSWGVRLCITKATL